MKTKKTKTAAFWKRAKRHRKAACIVLLVLVGAFGSLPLWQEEGIIAQDQLIRFHVIANSDSVADQDVKLMVRDAILDYIHPMLNEATSEAAAYELLAAHSEKITDIAEAVLEEEGFGYGARRISVRANSPQRPMAILYFPPELTGRFGLSLEKPKGKTGGACFFRPSAM